MIDLVSADAVPEIPADLAALIAAADEMAAQASVVAHRTSEAAVRWSTLHVDFETPDTATAVALMHPAVLAAEDFDTTLSSASAALRALGECLAALETTRASLLNDIAAHRSTVLAYRDSDDAAAEDPHDPLSGWGPAGYTTDQDLRLRCRSLRSSIQIALEECERGLRSVPEGFGFAAVAAASEAAHNESTPDGSSWRERAESFVQEVSLRVLERLQTHTADEITELLAQHPEWQDMLRDHPPSPDAVHDWWGTLDTSAAAALIAGASRVIGNLEGAPYSARDAANRTQLDLDIASTQRQLDDLQPGTHRPGAPPIGLDRGAAQRKAALQAKLATLQNIAASLCPPPGRVPRSLVSLIDGNPPLAAVAIGDLDTADNVTYTVPGMGTTTADMVGWTDASQNLADEQARQSAAEHHAVVAWVGYQTPAEPGPGGGVDVFLNDLAQRGGDRLDSALRGLAAVRCFDAPTLNVLAHSYGTTTASFALSRPDAVHVHTFVSLGSAGLPTAVSSAQVLNADEVYAAQARNVIPFIEDGEGDQWAATGRFSVEHPVDPSSVPFGATRFGADGGDDGYPVTDHAVHVPEGQGWGYLDSGTESLHNVARATTGQGELVSPAKDTGPTGFDEFWDTVLRSPDYTL